MKGSMRRVSGLCGWLAAGAWALSAGAAPLELKSPDGRLAVVFDVKTLGSVPGCPCYRVDFKGRPVIAESRLGLVLTNAPSFDQELKLSASATRSHDETWRPVCGERAEIRDHYNELSVELEDGQAQPRRLRLTFRAYDEGAAFRYELPKQPGLESFTIARELTQFHFPSDCPAWATYQAQGVYEHVPLSAIRPGCERPLVVEVADDLVAAVAEARLVDYARMKLRPAARVPHALEAFLDAERGANGLVSGAAPFASPWRAILVAESPGKLLEQNYLLADLNDPCALADTSWIKPGKCIREVTLTTAGGKACVDFAVQRGLQYVEFDAGWYGNEYDAASDASGVHVDPKRSKGPLDLAEVIRYGAEHGIGVLLYVNHLAAEKQLDRILPLYRQWGVKGVKYGFVNVGSQRWTAWLHEAIRKAAEQHLMVDVHDEYRPSGYSRTYPNLMTAEGVRGDETSPTNSQTIAIAFTRMLAGPADNTVCYYDARVDRMASHAYQLAKPVCLFSPWQFLYWYDRPGAAPQRTGGAGGAQTTIGDEPELEFYNALPTTWDETRVLEGRIGGHALIARRSGGRWFVGCLNSGQPRTFALTLDFLPRAQGYEARIYTDDPAVPTRTHVRIERRRVDAATVLSLKAGATGGAAVWLQPVGP